MRLPLSIHRFPLMSSSSTTIGVRTWQRTGAQSSAALSERITETTAPGDMATAIADAAFVTIPRLGVDARGADAEGYDDAYAEAFGAVLAARFGYAGGRRVSTTGRSHVFERETAPVGGASVDFGLPPLVSVAVSDPGAAEAVPVGAVVGRRLAGAEALTAVVSGAGASGDGLRSGDGLGGASPVLVRTSAP